MKDYIIVGFGLAGVAIAHQLEKRKKSFIVFENAESTASMVAGGVYNPVILKRFTLAWNAKEQLQTALEQYKELEDELNVELLKNIDIFRRFSSAEEQNNWFSASDKPGLDQFLDITIRKEINVHVPNEFGFGKVNEAGMLDIPQLISAFRSFLKVKNQFIEEDFQHKDVAVSDAGVEYNGLKAKKLIFCEGFGLNENPFFDYLPLSGNKGEYLIVKAEELKLDVILKSSFFIIPIGNDLYKIGANYKHGDFSTKPTEESRKQLQAALEKLILCPFKIVDQVAGIRPASKDRRPFVGQHPEYKQLFICNGFGSRGILIAPTAAKSLIANIEESISIDPEMDIKRFASAYFQK